MGFFARLRARVWRWRAEWEMRRARKLPGYGQRKNMRHHTSL